MLLGHSERFSVQYLNCLKSQSTISLNDHTYLNLYKLLKDLKPENLNDQAEWCYLRAKLAIILNDLQFFSIPQTSKNQLLGYRIWRAYAYTFENSYSQAQVVLDSLKDEISSNDFLLYSDYKYVQLRLFVFSDENLKIVDNSIFLEEYLSFLPFDAAFTRFGIFHTIALANLQINRKKTEEIIKRALISTHTSTDLFNLSKLLNIAGYLKLKKGKFTEGRIFFKRALMISRNIKDKIGEAERLRSLSSIEMRIGDHKKALRHLKEALVINKTLNDYQNLANNYLSLAWILDRSGRVSEAEQKYIQALQLFQKIDSKSGIIRSYGGLATIYEDQGKISEAIASLLKAKEMAEKLQLFQTLAQLSNSIGVFYKKLGDYSKSFSYLSEAMKYYNEVESPSDSIKTLVNISDVYRLKGEFSQAFDMIKEASKLVTEENEDKGYILVKQAYLHFDLGHLPQARKAALNALEIFEKINAPTDIAIARRLLGKINHINGNTEESITNLIGAFELLAKKQIFSEHFLQIGIDIAEIYALGKNFQQSEEWLSKLESKCKRREIEITDYIQSRIEFVKIYRKLVTKKLIWNDLSAYTVKIESKNYFDLQIKSLLLEIRFCIQNNMLKKALRLITKGKDLSADFHIIILGIELQLLNALVYAARHDFTKALEACKSITDNLRKYSLDYYSEQQRLVIERISTSQKTFSELYSLSEKEIDEKSHKKPSSISKEVLLDYIDQTLKIAESTERFRSVIKVTG